MNLTFTPWRRRSLGPAFASAGTAARATVTVSMTFDDGTDTPLTGGITAALLGPGEIVGLDPSLIVRTWPARNTANAEANFFACVDFSEPDLPWRYTPERPATAEADRMHPWLALLVLREKTTGHAAEAAEFTWVRAGGAPLPAVRLVGGTALPDLTESWAWAHAQTDATTSISRVLCPRRLQTGRSYRAVLVPTYARGVLAGSGVDPGNVAGQDRAWTGTSADEGLTLPVYFSWSFKTSPETADFEELVAHLGRARRLTGVGRRRLRASLGGGDLTEELEGALQASDASPRPEVGRAFVLNGLGLLESDRNDPMPVLRAPTYGATAAMKSLDPGRAEPRWIESLNLDPCWRVVAGLGAEVVRKNQEAYMAAAWEVVEDVRALNAALARHGLSREVGRRLHRDLFDRGSDAWRRLAGLRPILDKLAFKLLPDLTVAQLDVLRRAGDPQLVRVGRPMGSLARRAGFRATRDFGGKVLGKIAGLASAPRIGVDVSWTTGLDLSDTDIPTHTPGPGFLDLHALVGDALDLSALADSGFTAEWLSEIAAHPTATAVPLSYHGPGAEPADADPDAASGDSDPLSDLKRSLVASSARPVKRDTGDDLGTAILAAFAELARGLDPDTTIAESVRAYVNTQQPGYSVFGVPVLAVPRFDDATALQLESLGRGWILPGLDKVTAETIALMQTNPPFVEAFLVGLNQEMARELRWREYPTDQRGTCFGRFWPALSDAAPDISDIHTWDDVRLGEHPGSETSTTPRMVILLRSVLLERYPGTRVYLRKAGPKGADGKHTLGNTGKSPIFFDRMEDVAYFGFDLTVDEAREGDGWWVVFEEPFTEPRFGADVSGTDPIFANDWSTLSWEHLPTVAPGSWLSPTVLPNGVARWSYDDPAATTPVTQAADLALCLLQRPVRLEVHLSDLFPTSEAIDLADLAAENVRLGTLQTIRPATRIAPLGT